MLTKEVSVKVFAVCVGHAFGGTALFFLGLLTTIWVNGGKDDDSGLID